MIIVGLSILLILPSSSWGLSLSTIFSNGMVLQASPYKSQVFGSLNGAVEGEVKVTLTCESFSVIYTAEQSGDEWLAVLDDIQEGTTCTIEVSQEGQTSLFLDEIYFGDVWVCSGQSNMEWPMSAIFNATQEVADIANYPNIRMILLPHTTSSVPIPNVVTGPTKWFGTGDTSSVQSFSAVCLLYAKAITQKIGGNKVFGLIESNWGGTRVEPWLTPEGIAQCLVPPTPDEPNPEMKNSYIYNAMIHPLLKLTIKGALWYQGESNALWNQDLYDCTFPTMISEWRRLWSSSSDTEEFFPFGFVQLAPWRPNYSGSEFPVIRWHQTADIGYVPNPILPAVFMAVSIDTYDAESGIHPRNKQLVVKRLATAGLNVAYGFTDQPTNGPFPSTVLFTPASGQTIVEIVYDQVFNYELKESNGFYFCCEAQYELCDSNNAWSPLTSDPYVDPDQRLVVAVIDSCATGFAYLWNETPIEGTETLPIYSANEAKLPAAPWTNKVVLIEKRTGN